MLDQTSGAVQDVAWSERFPWLLLARCFRIAIQPRQLVLGAVGILLTLVGWTLLGFVFSGDETVAKQLEPYGACPWLAATAVIPDWAVTREVPPAVPSPVPSPVSPFASGMPRDAYAFPVIRNFGAAGAEAGDASIVDRVGNPGWGVFWGWEGPFWSAWEPLWSTWEHLSRPFRRIFSLEATRSEVAFSLVCALWAAAVWGFFGAMIARSAALQVGTRQRDRLGTTLRFAAAKWRWFFAAPLIPLVGVLLIVIPLAIAGLLLRVPGLSFLVALAFWPFLLVGGGLVALLLLGLVFGWPLLWGLLSAEEGDSFDAISRMYNYVYQRPLHYLFYAVVAALIGALGWLVVWNFVAGTVAATYWAASWGAGLENVRAVVTGEGATPRVVRFWAEAVKLLGVGFLFSYFWATSAVVFLLLRHEIDATEIDEVLPEQEDAGSVEPLPALRSDAAGAPVLDDGRKETDAAAPQEPKPTP